MAVSQFLRNTSALIENTFYVDGTGTNADGAVTVTVVRADGTTLSTGAATSVGSGLYRYSISPQVDLDFFTVSWSGVFTGVTQIVTTHAEVVGGFIFTEAQARGYDGGAMTSSTVYPDSMIREARARITDALEHGTGVSWVTRFRRVTLDGSGTDTLRLPNLHPSKVQSLSDDGTLLTSPQLAELELDDSGEIYYPSGMFTWGRRTIVVEYEHGFPYHRDGVDRMALMWLRSELVRSNVPDRALVLEGEMGTYRLSVPVAERPSGIPMIDAWIASHDMRVRVA